jgi:hypothetical protein
MLRQSLQPRNRFSHGIFSHARSCDLCHTHSAPQVGDATEPGTSPSSAASALSQPANYGLLKYTLFPMLIESCQGNQYSDVS